MKIEKWPYLSCQQYGHRIRDYLACDVWFGGQQVGSDDDRHDCCHRIVFIVTRLNNAAALPPKISALAATFVRQSGEIQFEIPV